MSTEKGGTEEDSYCHKCGSGEFDNRYVTIEGKVVTRTVCVCGELLEVEVEVVKT